MRHAAHRRSTAGSSWHGDRLRASTSGWLTWLALCTLAFAGNVIANTTTGGSPHGIDADSRNDRGVFKVAIAASSNTNFNGFFATLLNEQLGSKYAVELVSPDKLPSLTANLLITLGASTLNEATQLKHRPPLLALLVDERQFSSYQDNEQTSEIHNPPLSALYSDPPLLRQALLGLRILPQASRVAVLARPGMESGYRKLAQRLAAFGLELRVFTVESMDDLIANLTRALNYADFLLGTRDPAIYNRQTIKPILLTTYRRNRILIGPGRAFVRAGALASTFTPVTPIAEQAATIIRSFQASKKLPSPGRVSAFQVQFNQQVAASLNIVLPDPAATAEALRVVEASTNSSIPNNPIRERRGQ